MSGVGRRSQYRKHLTESILHDLPVPKFDEGERIAKVLSTRGGNQFEVIVADPPSHDTLSQDCNDEKSKSPALALLPKKFHKLVWIKRHDFLIVRGGITEPGPPVVVTKSESSSSSSGGGGGGVRYIIIHVLYKDQIKHLQKEDIWPNNDRLFTDPYATTQQQGEIHNVPSNQLDAGDDSPSDEDDDYFVNTNRLAKMRIQDSSDEESLQDEE